MTIIILLLTSLSFADAGFFPSKKDDCRVEKLEQEGTTCRSCNIGDTGGEPGCETMFEGTDFTRVCAGDDAMWNVEVWCDGPPKEGGCGCDNAGSGTAAFGFGLALLALGRHRRD